MATIQRRKKRTSKLYDMKIGDKRWLSKYEYGVSHISKRLDREYVQRQHGKRVLCVRVQ